MQDQFREMFRDFSLGSHLKFIFRTTKKNGCRYWVPSRHIRAVRLKKNNPPLISCQVTQRTAEPREVRSSQSTSSPRGPSVWMMRTSSPRWATRATDQTFTVWKVGDGGGREYLCVTNLVPPPFHRCSPAGLGSNLAKVLLPHLSLIHNPPTFCEEHEGSRRGMSSPDPQAFQNPFQESCTSGPIIYIVGVFFCIIQELQTEHSNL